MFTDLSDSNVQGEDLVKLTVSHMIRLINRNIADAGIRAIADSIMQRNGIAPHDTWGEGNAIFRFTQQKLTYRKDPVNNELLREPVKLMRMADLAGMTGDCDDHTMMNCALFGSIGGESRIVVCSTRKDQKPHHVYAEFKLKKPEGLWEWVAADSIYPQFALGETFPNITKKWIYTLDKMPLEISTISGDQNDMTNLELGAMYNDNLLGGAETYPVVMGVEKVEVYEATMRNEHGQPEKYIVDNVVLGMLNELREKETAIYGFSGLDGWNFFQKVGEWFRTAGPKIAQGIKNFAHSVANVYNSVVNNPIVHSALSFIPGFSAVDTGIKAGLNLTESIASGAIGPVQNILQKTVATVANKAQALANKVIAKVSDAAANISASAQAAASKIANRIESGVQKVSDFAERTAKEAGRGVESAIEKAGSGIAATTQKIATGIDTALKGASDDRVEGMRYEHHGFVPVFLAGDDLTYLLGQRADHRLGAMSAQAQQFWQNLWNTGKKFVPGLQIAEDLFNRIKTGAQAAVQAKSQAAQRVIEKARQPVINVSAKPPIQKPPSIDTKKLEEMSKEIIRLKSIISAAHLNYQLDSTQKSAIDLQKALAAEKSVQAKLQKELSTYKGMFDQIKQTEIKARHEKNLEAIARLARQKNDLMIKVIECTEDAKRFGNELKLKDKIIAELRKKYSEADEAAQRVALIAKHNTELQRQLELAKSMGINLMQSDTKALNALWQLYQKAANADAKILNLDKQVRDQIRKQQELEQMNSKLRYAY